MSSTSFQENIQKWVKIDNQIKVYNEKIKALRGQKGELTDTIMDQADDNGYKNAVIQISDGKLKFTTSKVQSPLTFRYVEEVLGRCISNKDTCSAIIQSLKSNRETKVVEELKRYNTG